MIDTPENTQLSFDFSPQPDPDDTQNLTLAFTLASPEDSPRVTPDLATGLLDCYAEDNKKRNRQYRPALSEAARWAFVADDYPRPPDLPLDGFASRFCPSIDLNRASGLPILAFENHTGTVLMRTKKRLVKNVSGQLHPIERDPHIAEVELRRHDSTNCLPDDPGYGELLVYSYEIGSNPTIKSYTSLPREPLLHRAAVRVNDSIQRQITDDLLNMIAHATALNPAKRSLTYDGFDLGEMLHGLDQHFEAQGLSAPNVALSPRMMRALIEHKPEGFLLRSIPKGSDLPPQIGWFVRTSADGSERVMRVFFTVRAPTNRIYASCSGSATNLMTCVTSPYAALDVKDSKKARMGWVYYLELGVVLADPDSVAVMTLNNVPEILAL